MIVGDEGAEFSGISYGGIWRSVMGGDGTGWCSHGRLPTGGSGKGEGLIFWYCGAFLRNADY